MKVDTKKFEALSKRYKDASAKLVAMTPELADEALSMYRQGVRISYIIDTSGISTATFYRWIRTAKDEDGGVVLRRPGRSKKGSEKPRFAPKVNPLTLPDIPSEYDFAWYDDRVRVDYADRRVIIDTERIDFTGDRDLGQLLVSGTDVNLIRQFNQFVNGSLV